MARLNDLMLEGAVIGYKNFRGERSNFNSNGERHFSVFFEEAQAQELADLGYNVKFPVQDPDSPYEKKPHLQVAVRFNPVPPEVWMIADGNMTRLNEATIDILDRAVIQNVDLIINPYRWERETKQGVTTGIKAYTKKLFVTIETDAFQKKYGHMMPTEGMPADQGPDFGDYDVPF